MASSASEKIYVVEHLDPELEQWSALEYKTIAEECQQAGAKFILSSVSPTLKLPPDLEGCGNLHIEKQSVETLFADRMRSVCLLDPSAVKELTPDDGDKFAVFLFGGILGDDPPRDRTAELRKKGFEGRKLGPVQMTTDTAVRTTRIVVQEKSKSWWLSRLKNSQKKGRRIDMIAAPLDRIPYIDYPEIRLDEHESTEMPFRYVKQETGEPVMPKGMIELIRLDADKGFGELL